MRYIIDVTQLIHWPGNLTGIPRVMDELAIRFLNDTSREAIFVSWVKEAGAMCELDFISTREQRGKHIAYKNHLTSSSQESLQVQNHSNQILKSSSQLPKKIIKKVAVKSRFDRTFLYKKLVENKKQIEAKLYKKYTPQKNDKLFIPWGEWWDQDWLDLMKDFSSQGVNIYPVSHDVLPMIVPQFSGNSSSLENFVKQVFPISKKILAVSKSSKNDLAAWMTKNDVPVPDIEVFRLGEDFSFEKAQLDSSKLTSKYNVEQGNYLIYVSTIEPRKNHLLFYYTYKLAASKGIKLPRLVIVGRVGHDMDAIIAMINRDPEVNASISIENDVDDNDLNWLYENSMFTVTSSFYEGWGMSVLESITRGKPVVCSNTSSLLEMPDDCVIRFNPSSTDDCLSALTKMSQPETLNQYRENAKKYKTHSWDDSYRQVVSILDGDDK